MGAANFQRRLDGIGRVPTGDVAADQTPSRLGRAQMIDHGIRGDNACDGALPGARWKHGYEGSRAR